MGYIGRGQPDRVLTSADIGEGAVTLADISFTDQPANVNITGDYPKQTMRLCDNATVTGDVTIGDGLILAKLASDGDSVTLTSDGTTRTISGTGLIEANTIAQSPNQSLTGMTGTLDSGVTLGSSVTGEIGSAVTGGSGLSLTGMTGIIGNTVTGGDGLIGSLAYGHDSSKSTLGSLRIVCGTATSPSSSSTGGSTYGLGNQYYNYTDITLTGFASPPTIIAMIDSNFHEAKINHQRNISSTYVQIRAACSRSAGIHDRTIHYIAIGEAS